MFVSVFLTICQQCAMSSTREVWGAACCRMVARCSRLRPSLPPAVGQLEPWGGERAATCWRYKHHLHNQLVDQPTTRIWSGSRKTNNQYLLRTLSTVGKFVLTEGGEVFNKCPPLKRRRLVISRHMESWIYQCKLNLLINLINSINDNAVPAPWRAEKWLSTHMVRYTFDYFCYHVSLKVN